MRLNRNTLLVVLVGVLAAGKFIFPEQFAMLQQLVAGGEGHTAAQRDPAAQVESLQQPAANNSSAERNANRSGNFSRLEQAVANQEYEVWLEELPFEVIKLLKDDLEGSQHQRFLVTAPGLPTFLIAHNIDLAPRVPLREGDRVHIRGRYEWNNKGGVIHWTHHDPKGRKTGGWIRHREKTYK